MQSLSSNNVSSRQQFRQVALPRTSRQAKVTRSKVIAIKASGDTLLVGLAADSGCGKSTFMRRMMSIFGADPKPIEGGNPDSNSLISDMFTVICLDDYHSLDRNGRKRENVTALNPAAQFFDLMYEQMKDIKNGKSIQKPIYNHVTGLIDAPEQINPPKIYVAEGLHPFYDERVRDLLDLKIYLDISDEVKYAWKIQRDSTERGHSVESVKASIEARKPDFNSYIDVQKQHADLIIQVLPSSLVPDGGQGKIMKVRLIQKEDHPNLDPVFLFDEGCTVSWIPCGRKLTCSYPGIKFYYGPDSYYGQNVSVIEMDGVFDKIEELIYIESHLSKTSTKFYGEVTQQLLRNSKHPGSNNGTGLFQTIVGLKMREVYERKMKKEILPAL